jgi:hypothetical protein
MPLERALGFLGLGIIAWTLVLLVTYAVLS